MQVAANQQTRDERQGRKQRWSPEEGWLRWGRQQPGDEVIQSTGQQRNKAGQGWSRPPGLSRWGGCRVVARLLVDIGQLFNGCHLGQQGRLKATQVKLLAGCQGLRVKILV